MYMPASSFSAGQGVGAPAPTLTPEQSFLENLQQRISQSGATHQDCISQLRALDLGDDFWMHIFKVVPCAKTYSHKWTLCPCAHAGETARRRDPRTIGYKAILCPLIKAKKTCPLGDACSYAHNVFEHWLHPSRYKTRLCSFGRNCNRPICFFAHSAEELRCVPSCDEGKEPDEREYLLQLMMAQDNGLLPPGTNLQALQQAANGAGQQQPNQYGLQSSLQHHHSMPPQQLSSLLDMPGMGMGYHGMSPARTKSGSLATHSMSGLAPPARSHSTSGIGDQAMLAGLQEALASFSLSVDGLSAIGGGGQGAGRTSDPGLPPGAHPNGNGSGNNNNANNLLNSFSSVHSLPHLNRISDSGQTLSLANSKGLVNSLESLLPVMNQLALQQQQQQAQQQQQQAAAVVAAAAAAVQQQQQQQQMVGSPNGNNGHSAAAAAGAQQSSGSPPHSPQQSQQAALRCSSPGASSTSSASDLALQRQLSGQSLRHQSSGPLSVSAGSTATSIPSSGTPQPQQQQNGASRQALQALAGAANGGNNGVSSAYVTKILGELQEQGLAGSREQLAAALSQLVIQLTAVSN